MDVKLILAKDVCAALGYRLFHGRCDTCGFPLLEKCLAGTWFIGCWFCHDRKEFALSARAALHKARMRSAGIEIGVDQLPLLMKKPDVGLEGRQMYGQPL